ncbi:MAG: hypothetical protein HWD63_10770 [Candidatus Parvibacillus calidus]|jgi:hypothetical protein|nr:MAG: hypothetical protein HWD63_10770 [Candidatus Parvibacillus calidus]
MDQPAIIAIPIDKNNTKYNFSGMRYGRINLLKTGQKKGHQPAQITR